MATRIAATLLACKDGYYANRVWRIIYIDIREKTLRTKASESWLLDPAQIYASEIAEQRVTKPFNNPHAESRNIFNVISKHPTNSIEDFQLNIGRRFKPRLGTRRPDL